MFLNYNVNLNAFLLKKIEFLHTVHKVGVLLVMIFFLIATGYFFFGNVHQSIAALRKKKKNFRGGKRKNKRHVWKIFGLLGMFVVMLCGASHVFANEEIFGQNNAQQTEIEGKDRDVSFNQEDVKKKVIDMDIQSPVIDWETGQWNTCEDRYPGYLFSQKDQEITVQIAEENFNKGSGTEELLLQVMKRSEDGKWQSEGKYGIEDFQNLGADSIIHQKRIRLRAELGEAKYYKINMKYKDGSGNDAVFSDFMKDSYGTLSEGKFSSVIFVIDKKSPLIDQKIILDSAGEKRTENGNVYYQKGIKGRITVKEEYLDDTTVSIKAVPCDDRARMSVKNSNKKDVQGNIRVSDWTCSKRGKESHLVFPFDENGQWKFIFQCADIAGNVGVAMETDDETVESGECIIDHESPRLQVKYEGQKEIAEITSSPWNVNREISDGQKQITSSENEIFFKEQEKITLRIQEDYFRPEDVKAEMYRLQYASAGDLLEKEEQTVRWDMVWEKKGACYYAEITNLLEGHYYFTVSYTDTAGNSLLPEEAREMSACFRGNQYQSPLCTVDRTKPVLQLFSPKKAPVQKKGSRQYFQEQPTILLKIAEENFNKKDCVIRDAMTGADGNKEEQKEKDAISKWKKQLQWKTYYEKGIRINETEIPIEEQTNHELSVEFGDKAGNQGKGEKIEITYDREKPEISYKVQENDKGVIFRPYASFSYFSRGSMKIAITAHDKISGADQILYSVLPWKTEGTLRKDSSIKKSNPQKAGQDLSVFLTEIDAGQDNFKGYFKVKARDFSGNESGELLSKGMISESKELHKKTSGIQFRLPKAVYTDQKNKVKYYREKVKARAIFTDSYSGIYKTIFYGRDSKGKKESKEKTWEKEKDLTYEKGQSLLLNPEKFCTSCRENPVKLTGSFEDNAGNQSYVTDQNYKIVLDHTSPEIQVTYDGQREKNSFYNRERTATITVKDWNFNPASVNWKIRGSNTKYEIGKWKGQGNIHRCNIYFREDGEDYGIGLTLSDYAGNKAAWEDPKTFTIDRTPPEVSIDMDRKGRKNDRYYRSARTVSFCIKEKNFENCKIIYKIQRISGKEKGKEKRKEKEPEDYTREGICHYSQLVLKRNGRYRIGVQCTDAAGNSSGQKELEEFIIDTTLPKIKVSGVEKGDTYTGKVCPQVICTDENLAGSCVKAVLRKADGKRTGEKEYPFTIKNGKNHIEYLWSDFTHKEKTDGIYLLDIKGEDLAGNKITQKIRFQVNRFGADYELDRTLVDILQKKYLKQEEDIILKEWCVNPVRTKVILMRDHEERTEITEKDGKGDSRIYTVTQKRNTDKKNERYGWWEKTICIRKENFQKEGEYHLLIQSDAHIGKKGKQEQVKSTDNEIRKKSIRFIVDKTPPSVSIGNLEEIFYEEKEHPFTITVFDNYALDFFELQIGQGNERKTEKVKIRPEEFGENHTVTRILFEKNHYQKIRYIVRDKAGNQMSSDETGDSRKCLVTTNKVVQMYYAEPLFCGTGVVLTALAVIAFYRFQRGRKKESQKNR